MEIIKHTDADYAEKRARLNRRAAPAPEVEATVAEILETVRTRGDAGLLELTEKFDGATLTAETLRVTEAVMAEARESVSEEVAFDSLSHTSHRW